MMWEDLVKLHSPIPGDGHPLGQKENEALRGDTWALGAHLHLPHDGQGAHLPCGEYLAMTRYRIIAAGRQA